MQAQELINTKGSVVQENRIQQFRTNFRGNVVRLGEDGYENACKIWNAGVQKRPGIVASCSGVADAVSAVGFAQKTSCSRQYAVVDITSAAVLSATGVL